MNTLSLMRNAGLIALTFAATSASAQSLSDLKPSPEPLVLQSQGSFFVGGRTVETENAGWSEMKDVFGQSFEAGEVLVDQMYVQFQTPPEPSHTPIVFMHGGLLSSKQWETTPDGRMGWYEYFTRQGFPTYMAEQTGRARSGFNATIFNQVRVGSVPPSKQPRVFLGTSNMAWKVFRFGPELGEAWPSVQFPMDHVDEFYKQVIPDTIETQVPSLLGELTSPETSNPTVENVATLAQELGGAVLVGHSQSAGFPTQAVLKNKGGIKGIIQLETGCFSNLTDDQVQTLAEVPILVIVGDYLGEDPDAACVIHMEQIEAAGGDMTFISLPDVGLEGNSHMFMQDENNLRVADVLVNWVSEHVDRRNR
ncbi:alpha/beta hydrolase family protein [Mesorhizobium xinjiangense]|uniref:esterase n=1 Tax=Mesorhizobium xinjiangense TaxID=2678685 RepID=UPI0012EE5847|nr:esterase [Mesorhizobium xinjiangense]